MAFMLMLHLTLVSAALSTGPHKLEMHLDSTGKFKKKLFFLPENKQILYWNNANNNFDWKINNSLMLSGIWFTCGAKAKTRCCHSVFC